MTEFEFDKESADRIAKTINSHVMCLKDCADILEMLAPLCDLWSPQGLQVHIRQAFSAQFRMVRDLEFGKELNSDE